MVTCCSTRSRWMRWTSVAYILERAAGRCTVRRTPATAGGRLCAICRRYIRSRCRCCDRDAAMIRVELPGHLRALARVQGEVTVEVAGTVSVLSVLDAVETQYPMLRGTIRDHVTQQRRPFLRFFACGEDLSHEPPETPLPEAVANGKEPLLVVGAIAGG